MGIMRLFRGGVHPAENKDLSERCPITPLPMPPLLFVPLHQHLGRPAEPLVHPGDKVLKGQRIGAAQGFVSAPVHAPTSGTVVDVRPHTVGHPSGLTMLCVVIEPDGQDQWSDTLQGLPDPENAEPFAIREKIKDAGIVGMGGATFPSFIKMSPPQGKAVDLLILNGVECEPYLTCDARLMEERAALIVEGARIMLRALQTRRCVIAIEANKPGAIRVMQQAVAKESAISVQELPVMYPQGAEKQLIQAVIKREVPSGGLPIDVGVIVHNVATALAIRDAACLGRPLISRAVTISGRGVKKPANVEALVGTPVSRLLDHCGGLKPGVRKVVMGGPMMGVTLVNLEAPVTKGTSGLLALLPEEIVEKPEQPCIRCGNCLRACPIGLMPTEMAWLSRHDQLDRLQEEYHLLDCIECGSCSYVCPSNIPLVHYFRYAKLAIQAKRREKERVAKDKERTAAKEARVAKELAEKERKKAEMKAKSAARKGPAEPQPAESA